MPNSYCGFVVYGVNKSPVGVVSSNCEKQALFDNNSIPDTIKKCLISVEDRRYYHHGAIDFRAIARAFFENMKAGEIVQGGSTITQQLARNILRDGRRNIIRKIKEIKLAYELENKYTKEQILDMYFKNVFWGKRNYGIRTASLEYFSKEPQKLNIAEQIALLTLLRGPNYYLRNEDQFNKRNKMLSSILSGKEIISLKKASEIKNANIKIQNNPLEVFNNASIPFLTTKIITKKKTIETTLNNDLQNYLSKFVASSIYPISAICLEDNKVIAVSSTYGSDYPFTFRSNVGSTLKPFIYSFLRENGVNAKDAFSTKFSNYSNWNIGEVQNQSQNFMTLEEALLTSNNNVFANACYGVGIEKTIMFLSKITKKPISNFVPSSILGSTVDGLSLHELAKLYYRFFYGPDSSAIKKECLVLLNKIAEEKFKEECSNIFLKTGTTNLNKERFAMLGYSNKLFGFLRQGNSVNDYSKEGKFISNILEFLKTISKKVYKWD